MALFIYSVDEAGKPVPAEPGVYLCNTAGQATAIENVNWKRLAPSVLTRSVSQLRKGSANAAHAKKYAFHYDQGSSKDFNRLIILRYCAAKPGEEKVKKILDILTLPALFRVASDWTFEKLDEENSDVIVDSCEASGNEIGIRDGEYGKAVIALEDENLPKNLPALLTRDRKAYLKKFDPPPWIEYLNSYYPHYLTQEPSQKRPRHDYLEADISVFSQP